jgi:hypothetical protein
MYLALCTITIDDKLIFDKHNEERYEFHHVMFHDVIN